MMYYSLFILYRVLDSRGVICVKFSDFSVGEFIKFLSGGYRG